MAPPAETILVTGSSGLIGRQVVERLAGEFAVVGFDRSEPDRLPDGAQFVRVDMSSDADVREGLERVRAAHGERLAAVLHLAAYYDFSGRPSPLYEEITVRGTQRLLRGLQRFQVEQFAFSSTLLVHAPGEPGRPIDEEWPLEPKWDYPRSKVAAEQTCRAERGGIPVALLRIAGVYDDTGHSLPLAQQIQRLYERRLTARLYPGDLSRGQPFLHLDDLSDAFALLVERRRELPPELALLLGEEETLSYDYLQRELGRLIHGREWKTWRVPKPFAKFGAWLQNALPFVEPPFIKPWMIDLADDHYELDLTRARALLGWEPRRSLRATLPRVVHHLQADPLAWYREHKLKPPRWLERPARRPARAPARQP